MFCTITAPSPVYFLITYGPFCYYGKRRYLPRVPHHKTPHHIRMAMVRNTSRLRGKLLVILCLFIPDFCLLIKIVQKWFVLYVRDGSGSAQRNNRLEASQKWG